MKKGICLLIAVSIIFSMVVFDSRSAYATSYAPTGFYLHHGSGNLFFDIYGFLNNKELCMQRINEAELENVFFIHQNGKGNSLRGILNAEGFIDLSLLGLSNVYNDIINENKEVYVEIPILVTAISIKSVPTKTNYFEGESLDLSGLVLALDKSDFTTEDIAFENLEESQFIISPPAGTVLSTQDSKVTITHIDSNESTEFTIIVEEAPILEPDGALLHADAGENFTGVLYTREGNIYYNQIDLDNKWGSEVLIGEGVEGKIAVDSIGKIHVVYPSSGKISYKVYDGVELTEELIESNNGGTCSNSDIDVDSSGYAHITYTDTMGDTGGYKDCADIMYATNSSGEFVKELIFRGWYENYGGADAAADYYNKGSLITVDSNDNYYIIAHKYSFSKWMNGIDRQYSISVKSNLGNGSTSTSASDIFSIYDLEAKNNMILALYKDTNFIASSIEENVDTSNISFNPIVNIPSADFNFVNSVETDGENMVIGGIYNGNLKIRYNDQDKIYEDIIVKGNNVSIIEINQVFYALYTDNSSGLIKVFMIYNN